MPKGGRPYTRKGSAAVVRKAFPPKGKGGGRMHDQLRKMRATGAFKKY